MCLRLDARPGITTEGAAAAPKSCRARAQVQVLARSTATETPNDILCRATAGFCTGTAATAAFVFSAVAIDTAKTIAFALDLSFIAKTKNIAEQRHVAP